MLFSELNKTNFLIFIKIFTFSSSILGDSNLFLGDFIFKGDLVFMDKFGRFCDGTVSRVSLALDILKSKMK